MSNINNDVERKMNEVADVKKRLDNKLSKLDSVRQVKERSEAVMEAIRELDSMGYSENFIGSALDRSPMSVSKVLTDNKPIKVQAVWEQEHNDKLSQMVKDGASINDVAKEFNLTKGLAVYHIARIQDFKNIDISSVDIDAIKKMMLDGKSFSSACTELGLDSKKRHAIRADKDFKEFYDGHKSKWSSQYPAIKQMLNDGVSQTEIVNELGVSQSTVSYVKSRHM